MIQPLFLQEEHFFVKAYNQAKISFPISKEEAMHRAGSITVKTGFDTYTPLQDIIADFYPDYFPTMLSWLCAYQSSYMTKVKKYFNY